MPSNVADALSFIVGSIGQLLVYVLLLRFMLPWFRADHRNPLSQAILKVTSPLVVPLRRFIPAIGRIDTATLIVIFFVLYLTLFLIGLIISINPGPLVLALSAVAYIPMLILRLFFFLVIVRVIMSWISPGGYNPAIALFHALTDPIMRPFQRIIPPLGGFDISPVLVIILIGALIRLANGLVPFPAM
jgi:YggT family protein